MDLHSWVMRRVLAWVQIRQAEASCVYRDPSVQHKGINDVRGTMLYLAVQRVADGYCKIISRRMTQKVNRCLFCTDTHLH